MDRAPNQAGPPSGQRVNLFIVVTGETRGAQEQCIRNLERLGQIQKQSSEESDYILVFCPLSSRTGTDVMEAMEKIPSGKPVILVVMHHRYDVEGPLVDSSRHVSREDVILTVDTLFWEGKFLKCSHNDEAFKKVLAVVVPSSNSLISNVKYYWNKLAESFSLYLSLPDYPIPFPRTTSTSTSTSEKNIKQDVKGQLFNFFVAVTGETGGAHEDFVKKIEHFGQIKKESVEESDYILAFCPLPSRAGTDVEEAMEKIPRKGKPVILVVMHHRRDGEAPLGDSSRHVSREDVILTVDTLFWEGGFLNCSHNEKAFKKVLAAVVPSSISWSAYSAYWRYYCWKYGRPYSPITPSQDKTKNSASENTGQDSGHHSLIPLNKDKLLNDVKEYQLQNKSINHVRILLFGPLGAGKSSFINSVSSVLKGRMTHDAHVNTVDGGSCTKKYQTYKIEKGSGTFFPFVFNDIMGLGSEIGVHEDDIKLALEGHVKNGYEFKPSAMTVKHPDNQDEDNDPHYIHDPTPEDKIHVLVFVIPADQLRILSTAVIEKMNNIRRAASGMGIPRICILTKIDQICELVKNDEIMKKMEEFSAKVDISKEHIFPVKNYHEETDLNDDIDVLILTALQQMFTSGEDFINKTEKQEEQDGAERENAD